MCQLKKNDIEKKLDGKGRSLVIKTTDELTKNHRENDKEEDGVVMMTNGSPLCPVPSSQKYMSRLNPENEYLFQRPKTRKVCEDELWYDSMVLGENILEKKMKVISQQAQLSVVYTNHSNRAAAVSILNRSGFETCHIMSVCGHQSESCLKSYCKTGQNTKEKMADSLISVIASGSTSG